jgi:autotransporter-associated beta strand protein
LDSGNRTYGGVVSGTGNFSTTASGNIQSGVLNLTGNNTYTGGTFVTVGTLNISGGSLASTGNVSITGGSFNIGASNQTIGGFLIAGTQSAAATGNGSLTASSYDLRQGTVSLGLAGNASLTKNSWSSGSSYSNGVVKLSGNNTSTGNITVNAGILSFDTIQSLYSGNNSLWIPDKITVTSNATSPFTSTLALGTGNGDSPTAGFNNAQIEEIFENLTANGTVGLTANSSIGFNVSGVGFTLNTTITDRPDGGKIGMDKIGSGTLTLNASNTFTGPLNIYEGIVLAGTDNALSVTSSLVVDSKGGTTGYSVGNFSQQFVNVTLVSGTLAGGTGTINATGNYTMVSGTATANLAGAAPLVKTEFNGSSNTIVLLSGNNSYTGNTTINGSSWSSVPNFSGQWNAPSSSTSKLQFQTPGSLYTGNNATWNSGNITVNQYGIFSVLAGNGTAGFTESQIGTLITNLVTTNRSSGGFLGGSAIGIDTTGTIMTLTTQLTDSGVAGGGRIGLVKYGTGTLTLTGNNTHSLVTSITGGTLALDPAATLSSSSANVAISLGAALDMGSTNQTITSLSSSGGNILGNGTLTALAPGLGFSFIGSNVSVNLAGSSSVVIGGSNPPATTTFSGSNSYTGNTTVKSSANLNLANVNALSGSTLVFNESSSNLIFSVDGANTYNLGGLQSTNNIAIGNNTLSIGANGENTTYSGNLTGTGGALAKVGNGTLTLTGNNTYTGGTTISTGTLALGNGGTSGIVTGNITNNANLVFNRSGNVTFADIISGSGNVTKQAARWNSTVPSPAHRCPSPTVQVCLTKTAASRRALRSRTPAPSPSTPQKPRVPSLATARPSSTPPSPREASIPILKFQARYPATPP